MAYRSLRSTTSFIRHSITVSKIHPLPSLSSNSSHSTPDAKDYTTSPQYQHSHSLTNSYINNRQHLKVIRHNSFRSLCTTTATWASESVAKQASDPPSGGHDSSSSSSSDESSSDSSDDSAADEDGEGFDSVESIRLAVLDASLEFVNEHGWTVEAIAAGAESLGYSSMSHGLVEGGGGELFTHLQGRLNEQLELELQRLCREGEEHPQRKLTTSAFVEAALKYRLGAIVPYLGVWSRGLVVASMAPSTAMQGLHNLATLANHVCRYSGDKSFTTEWYAKRAAVVAVYKATELSLLQDKSPGYEDTWQFLHRRVMEAVSLEKNLGSLDQVAADVCNGARAALLTGLNILGLNTRSR